MSTDLCELSAAPLSLERLFAAVVDPSAGAVASFVGVTRDTFEGKRVTRLEYEAYEPMAVAELRRLCASLHARWTLCRVALAHRTGPVPVGEVSVVICVSSAHRAEALDAVRFAIDSLKASVPIWKKELYEGGDAEWKANAPAGHTGQSAAGAAAAVS